MSADGKCHDIWDFIPRSESFTEVIRVEFINNRLTIWGRPLDIRLPNGM